MLSGGDRSKFAETIAKGYGKKDGDEEGSAKEEEAEPAEDTAKEATGTELADAIKSGDGMEIYRAFEALVELCKGG